jgi:hypothetical protein
MTALRLLVSSSSFFVTSVITQFLLKLNLNSNYPVLPIIRRQELAVSELFASIWQCVIHFAPKRYGLTAPLK